jgi:hypothetical protein
MAIGGSYGGIESGGVIMAKASAANQWLAAGLQLACSCIVCIVSSLRPMPYLAAGWWRN